MNRRSFIAGSVTTGIACAAVDAQAHPAKCPPVACEPTKVEVARVWFVRVRAASGRLGIVQVNAQSWDAAGAAAAALDGVADVESVRAETFRLNEVSWDDE